MDFLGKDVTLGSSSAAEASPGGPRAEEWGLCWLYPQQWTQQVLPPRETWTVLTVSTAAAQWHNFVDQEFWKGSGEHSDLSSLNWARRSSFEIPSLLSQYSLASSS